MSPAKAATKPAVSPVVRALEEIERGGGSGTLVLPGRRRLEVTNLGKPFFPGPGYTKGDLMRYYARVATAILPAMAKRPLVLRRFPNGVRGPSFYQQKAPDHPPAGVDVVAVETEEGMEPRVIGGSLTTLLYLVQLGSISVDPWHAHVGALEYADYTVLDLDPGPRASFARVVEVAQWVKEALDAEGLHGVAKTSGSTGIHISVPLPARTTHETALLVAQLIATRVAMAHPKAATVERAVKARAPSAVYVDYLQNVRGKTVAGVYSARAKPGATVSTPLRWSEVREGLDPAAFTIETVPKRLAKVGDLWAAGMKARNPATAIRSLAK
jgi:bifunctional non-homologous end joining protein LigD